MEDDLKFISVFFVGLVVVMSTLSAMAMINVQNDDSYLHDDYRDYDREWPPPDSPIETQSTVHEPDWQRLEKSVVEIPYDGSKSSGSHWNLDISNNGLSEFLVVETNLYANWDASYSIRGALCVQHADRTCSTQYYFMSSISNLDTSISLKKGNHRFAFLFPGFKISTLEKNLQYEAWMMISEGGSPWTRIESDYVIGNLDPDAFESPRHLIQSVSVVDDFGVDLDEDSYYDNLTFAVDIDVLVGGEYHFSTFFGKQCIKYTIYHSVYLDLMSGYNRVELIFSGEQLYMMGLDGPYSLDTSIHLKGSDWSRPIPANYYQHVYDVNSAELDYSSQYYDHLEFQHSPPPAYFTGVAFDNGMDKDGDGLYDSLRISFQVQVDVQDDYRIAALLYHQPVNDEACMNKTYLDYKYVTLNLSVGLHVIQLEMSSFNIVKKALDGPYEVQLQIVPLEEPKDPLLIFNTGYYSHQAFE